MIFNSLTFAYFLVALVVVNALLPLRYRNGWILAGGFLFYMSWCPIYILLLLVTAAVDYAVALKMGSLPDQKSRKPWLIGSLVFNLGSLGFFKYGSMFLGTAGNLSTWLGLGWTPPLLDVALPLGISFYTFETISYGVDVYRGELKPKRSFFEYLNFLMFFPKLIAGPIVRASELLPQIPAPRVCTADAFREGLNLLMIGFGKKVLLADNIAPLVERVFADPSGNNRWMCIAAVYGYSMQVYLDFSAYTDIARGCGKFLGYDLPENFNRPYIAVSISDFWRRWHMTLSRWLRDYLYVPLGGNRGSKLATYRNLFLTMLVGGLWHGANWTFVAWGAMNGAFLVIEKAWHDLRGTKPKRAEEMGWAERCLRIAIVFHLITFTRVFFRAPTFGEALEMLKTIVAPVNFQANYDFAMFLVPAVSLAYVAVSRFRKDWLQFEPRGLRLVAYGAVLAVFLAFGATNAEFIYFQF
jgi:D-alanyl-lipoteichoic acid acyltransferase DltB (MBOAT superfamily)